MYIIEFIYIFRSPIGQLIYFHSNVGELSINVHSSTLVSILTLGLGIEYYLSLSEGDSVCYSRKQSFIL